MLKKLNISADMLVSKLLDLSKEGRQISILDSCGTRHLGSHLLIAGTEPVDVVRFANDDAFTTMDQFEKALSRGFAAVFTISYDFGRTLQKIARKHESQTLEPDIYAAFYDTLIVHDYATDRTFSTGNTDSFENLNIETMAYPEPELKAESINEAYVSNLTSSGYVDAVETIKEYIRRGDTYQANLTQKLEVELAEGVTPQAIFWQLRRDHPAAFAAYLGRGDSFVISASPERFFKIAGDRIAASPIKGTRKRGSDEAEDLQLRNELVNSEKDRAENIMIVDLLRNDLGRVCEYGSVTVKDLCKLEEHPTLFHLVSTIEGKLRADEAFTDVLTALFPCGSITGAPKIRTMRIIDELEPSPRGLLMGAIGYFIPKSGFDGLKPGFDLSVAIRTMVVRNQIATFNVGGGVTIDSDPLAEYEESMLKAKALLAALGNK